MRTTRRVLEALQKKQMTAREVADEIGHADVTAIHAAVQDLKRQGCVAIVGERCVKMAAVFGFVKMPRANKRPSVK